MVAGSTVFAQDSVLFFDIRDNASPNQLIGTPTFPYNVGAANGGGAGDAQTLYISPVRVDGWQAGAGWPNNDGDSNSATGKLWLYMDVKTDDSGAAGVMSSIGLDLAVTPPASPKNTIGSIGFTWDTNLFAGAGTKAGVSPLPPASGMSVKAVFVPVGGTPPAFDTTGGLTPVATHYKLGALSVVGGARNCTFGSGYDATSTYTLKMSVNGLLITRAFPSGTGDAQEDVAFGYAAGAPETPYANGNTAGASSTLPDATILVTVKGDVNGDGRCNATDQTGFNNLKTLGTGVATQRQVYAGDLNGDRRVNATDQTPFNVAKTHTACP